MSSIVRPVLIVVLGTIFDIGFRGNTKFDERFTGSKRVMKHFNSQMPCQLTYLITEVDKHLQKNYEFFKVGPDLQENYGVAGRTGVNMYTDMYVVQKYEFYILVCK